MKTPSLFIIIIIMLLFPSVILAESCEQSIYYANYMNLPEVKKTPENEAKYRGAFEAEQKVKKLQCKKD